VDTPQWISKSLCKNRHIDIWYPPLDTDNPDKYYGVAREVCRRCPVWKECLDAGTTETWGMWGGLTPLERTVIINKSPKPSAIRSHGTWVRYRQGCRCTDCTDVAAIQPETLNINSVPLMSEQLGDLDILRFLLFNQ
jgi:hypothetical protein